MDEFLSTLEKTLGAVAASAIVVFIMKWYLGLSRQKENEEASQRKVESDKKNIHDRIDGMSDDELSSSSTKLYDKIDGKS